MQASKRGLGRDELRYVMPEFLAAIRWATFAGELAPDLVSARTRAATDPPSGTVGAELTEFIARRSAARERVAELEPILYPPDPEVDDG